MQPKKLSITLDYSNTLSTHFTSSLEDSPSGDGMPIFGEDQASHGQLSRKAADYHSQPKAPTSLGLLIAAKTKNIAKSKKTRIQGWPNTKNTLFKTTQRGFASDCQIKPELQERFPKLIQVYDWMLQVSCAIKVSKDFFYFAVLIYHEAQERNESLRNSATRELYACAACTLSFKFQDSKEDYLQIIYNVAGKRCSLDAIKEAELVLFKTLNWRFPSSPEVQQETKSMMRAFKNYVSAGSPTASRFCSLHETIRGMLTQGSCYTKKIQVEFQYLVDIILLNRIWHLRSREIDIVGAMALFIVLSAQFGSLRHQSPNLEALFGDFCQTKLHWSQTGHQRMIRLALNYADQLNVERALSNVPLGIETRSQPPLYLPVLIPMERQL